MHQKVLLGVESVGYHLIIVFGEKVLLDGVGVGYGRHILLQCRPTLN